MRDKAADKALNSDGFEPPRLPGKPFMLVAAGVLLFLAVSMGVLWGIFAAAVPNRAPLPAEPAPAPRLQPHPRQELAMTRARENARLEQSNGKALIPIEKAMSIIAARGADAYAPIATQGDRP